MNKKFSTLVAGLLLAGAVNVHAADPDVWPMANLNSANQANVTDVDAYRAGIGGGYEVGKAYLLGASGTSVLYVKEVAGQFKLAYGTPTTTSVADLHKAMWKLEQIVAPAGAVAPKYVFVNMYTGTVLALNTANAVAHDTETANLPKTSVTLGGDITEWLNSESYKTPAPSPLYASLANDMAVGIAQYTPSGETEPVVYLAKYPKSTSTPINVISVKPFKASGLVLSANELNTVLGKMGPTATKDSYFQLSFSPALTQDNVFDGIDVQAQAIQQYELKNGLKESDNGVNQYFGAENAYYASLYPYTSKTVGTDAYKDLVNPDNCVAWKNPVAQYVALKTKGGDYVVVDTAYIAGTDFNSQGLIKLTTDGLYNAKNKTKYRQPSSYLFKFVYDATEGTVDVSAKRYLQISPKSTNANPDIYASGYTQKAYQEGSYWTLERDNSNEYLESTKVTLSRALLGTDSHLTLHAINTPNAAIQSNKLSIKLVPSSAYTPTSLASGAYLIKVVNSDNPSRIGKYWVANMAGGFEVMEQAVRQDFQHMPAAQWVVESNGTIAGSPVNITNREFGADCNINVPHSGVLYATEGGKCFFNGDILQFIPVEDAMNEYLGYNYLTADQLKDNTYTFNYLHDLAMDKPLNTKSEKDSVVWVDANDATTAFTLEPVITDSYGYNGDLKNVAKLKRVVYYIKVKDATKL